MAEKRAADEAPTTPTSPPSKIARLEVDLVAAGSDNLAPSPLPDCGRSSKAEDQQATQSEVPAAEVTKSVDSEAIPSEDTKAKQRNARYGHFVRVLVGPQPTEFLVHADVLKESAPFWSSCLSTDWQENLTREITMAEDDAAVFQHYVDWAYTGYVVHPCLEDGKVSVLTVGIWISFWLLADRFMAHALKNQIIDMLYEYKGHLAGLPPKDCDKVERLGSLAAPLRKFIRIWWLLGSSVVDYNENLLKDCPKIALFLLKSWSEGKWLRGTGWPQKCCNFHDHPDGIKCTT